MQLWFRPSHIEEALCQYLTVPFSAQTRGPVVTRDGRTVLVAVQQPGEITGATLEKPASTWSDGDFAKPAMACAWRLDRRLIGT